MVTRKIDKVLLMPPNGSVNLVFKKPYQWCKVEVDQMNHSPIMAQTPTISVYLLSSLSKFAYTQTKPNGYYSGPKIHQPLNNEDIKKRGTSGIDIDLRRVDIDQCPLPPGSTALNIFANSDKCKKSTTKCVTIPGLGFRRGSYKCECRMGFYFPDTNSLNKYYNGSIIEEEYEKKIMGEITAYDEEGNFECLACAEGCETCEDASPCVVTLHWVMRAAILTLAVFNIASLPVIVVFTWKYSNLKVIRAASPVLLCIIILGACFIYSTTLVLYPIPTIVTCSLRVWLREIGFSLAYGALMLKTWRISVIFRVRSAKAVKITDLDLMKRLGIIVGVFSVFLAIRTVVAPPHVIVSMTADDLKAFLCSTDWWDHVFTAMEMMFLVWGIRLCIMVRKAPSEFNESKYISLAIYNEFILSLFLNVSM
nr:probable G-protein coupled receptor CG31760 [Cherax quadricarinatus]